MTESKHIILERERLKRYSDFLALHNGSPESEDVEPVLLTFLGAVDPLHIYQLPRFKDRGVILRAVQYYRLGALAQDEAMVRERVITPGSAKGLDNTVMDTLTVEHRFLRDGQPVAREIKRVAVR
jgi:hypothetical protein